MESTDTQPAGEKTRRLEYCYDMRGDKQTAHVTVNPADSYDKTLRFARELLVELQRKVPFSCRINGEPEMHILDGDRRKGMLSVEMNIVFDISCEEARELFTAADFHTPTEYILG